jgi:hypothetical protein
LPRVTINKEKYMEADAVAFIEGRTRECGLRDKDIAEAIGLEPPAYCKRKREGRMKFEYPELVKMIPILCLTDEEIVALMRGKLAGRRRA